jgi:cobalt-zinc-cadmium efflux system membrane fusion protein
MIRTWSAAAVLLVAACRSAIPEKTEGALAMLKDPGTRGVALTPGQIRAAGIRWAPVAAMTMAEVIEVPGQLAANEDRTTRLSAPARARVTAVHVRIGDRVSNGQVLVTLQSEQAAAARAEHAKAIADLRAHQTAARYARTALERAERLLELKAISRQDVERARVETETADAMQTQAQADVERTRATLVQLGVDQQTGDMILRAPLSGVVLTRDVVPGSVVEAGAPLVMVTDPSTLWLDIAATERVAPVLQRGSRVPFIVPALGTATFEATIESVGGALDPATRTLPVHAVVRNSTGALRPAMFATVSLTLGNPRDGVAVPEAAMQMLEERPVVFVASGEDGGATRFERRDVEVGAKTRATVHVVRGLKPGDVVVIEGAFAVKSEFARAKTPAEGGQP